MAAADIECARRASLSLESSGGLDGAGLSLVKASSTASILFEAVSEDVALLSASLVSSSTDVPRSTGMSICAVEALPTREFTSGRVAFSTISSLVGWCPRSSSGGQVVCTDLGSEISVDCES